MTLNIKNDYDSINKVNRKKMNNTPKQTKVNIPMNEAAEVTCPECDKSIFDIVYKILKVSKLSPHNPTNQDIIKPIPYFKCANCKYILKEGD